MKKLLLSVNIAILALPSPQVTTGLYRADSTGRGNRESVLDTLVGTENSFQHRIQAAPELSLSKKHLMWPVFRLFEEDVSLYREAYLSNPYCFHAQLLTWSIYFTVAVYIGFCRTCDTVIGDALRYIEDIIPINIHCLRIMFKGIRSPDISWFSDNYIYWMYNESGSATAYLAIRNRLGLYCIKNDIPLYSFQQAFLLTNPALVNRTQQELIRNIQSGPTSSISDDDALATLTLLDTHHAVGANYVYVVPPYAIDANDESTVPPYAIDANDESAVPPNDVSDDETLANICEAVHNTQDRKVTTHNPYEHLKRYIETQLAAARSHSNQ